METSEILNTAADLIHLHGWVQGADGWWEDRSAEDAPGLCLEGGILAAMGVTLDEVQEMWACPAYNAVADYLNLDPAPIDPMDPTLPTPRQTWQWNDAEGPFKGEKRTADEVIGALRATALIEAAKEREAMTA